MTWDWKTVRRKLTFWSPAIVVGGWALLTWSSGIVSRLLMSALFGVMAQLAGIVVYFFAWYFVNKRLRGDADVDELRRESPVLVSALLFGAVIYVYMQFQQHRTLDYVAACAVEQAANGWRGNAHSLVDTCLENRTSGDYYDDY